MSEMSKVSGTISTADSWIREASAKIKVSGAEEGSGSGDAYGTKQNQYRVEVTLCLR